MWLILWFLLNEEDIVVALANEGVLDLLTLQSHQDLVFLFLHLVRQWLFLIFVLLRALFIFIVGLAGCLLPDHIAF